MEEEQPAPQKTSLFEGIDLRASVRNILAPLMVGGLAIGFLFWLLGYLVRTQPPEFWIAPGGLFFIYFLEIVAPLLAVLLLLILWKGGPLVPYFKAWVRGRPLLLFVDQSKRIKFYVTDIDPESGNLITPVGAFGLVPDYVHRLFEVVAFLGCHICDATLPVELGAISRGFALGHDVDAPPLKADGTVDPEKIKKTGVRIPEKILFTFDYIQTMLKQTANPLLREAYIIQEVAKRTAGDDKPLWKNPLFLVTVCVMLILAVGLVGYLWHSSGMFNPPTIVCQANNATTTAVAGAPGGIGVK